MADDKVALEIFIEADKAQMSLGDLEKGFDSMKERLKEVGRGSKEFKELSTAMAETGREVKNIELGFEALDNEQVASELGSVAGAVGDVTAAFVLMGGESETMQEMAASIQTAMAVSMGFKGAIEGVSSGMKLYNNLVKTGKIQTIAFGLATKVAAVAQRVLNAVMKANPIMLIVTAILAAVAAYKLLTAETTEATFAQKEYAKASEEAQKATVKEKVNLNQLLKVARDDTKSKEERQAAMEALNKLAPDYLGNITLETINTEEATKAVDSYVESLERKARATALQNKLVEIETALIDANNQSAEEQAGWASTLVGLKGDQALAGIIANGQKAETITKLEEEKQAILGLLEAENTYTDEYTGNAAERTEADKLAADEEARLAAEKLERDKLSAEQWKAGAADRAMQRDKDKQNRLDDRMVEIEDRELDLAIQTEDLDRDTIHIEGLISNQDLLRDVKAKHHESEMNRIAAERAAKLESAQKNLALASSVGNTLIGLNDAVLKNQLAGDKLSAKEKLAAQKKHFENSKKLNLAMAAINGAQAVLNALAGAPYPLNLFLAAGAAATTALQISAINKSKFEGGGAAPSAPSASVSSSAGSAGSASGGATINPVTNTSTVLGDTTVNVLETDITNTQNNVNVIEESATF